MRGVPILATAGGFGGDEDDAGLPAVSRELADMAGVVRGQ